MSYGEAWRMLHILMADPGTQVAASMGDWERPASRESLLLMDLYDLTHVAAGAKKPKPYPRPWPDQTTKRTGPGPGVTQEMVIAALRAAGHTVGMPPLVVVGRKRDAGGRFSR